jgi:RHS repeat-associated protein
LLTKLKNNSGAQQTYKIYIYDSMFNVTSIQNTKGTTMFSYDGNDKQISIIDAIGHNISNKYDSEGNLTSSTDQNGNVTSYKYDARNREIEVDKPSTGAITKIYENNNLIKSVSVGASTRASYTYDSDGRQTTMTFPQKNVTKTYYDNGLLKTEKDGTSTATYIYDNENRLTSMTYGSGHALSYQYYNNGLVLSATKNWGSPSGSTINYTYDNDNRLINTSSNVGPELKSYSYDKNGNKTSVNIAIGSTLIFSNSYSYDYMNRMTRSGNVTFTYDLEGNRLSAQYPNNTEILYNNYDEINRVGQIQYMRNELPRNPVILEQKNYTYDNSIDIKSETGLDETKQYSYDGSYRLTNVTSSKSDNNTSYNYDPIGERTGDEGMSWSYDGNGNATDVGGVNLTHDDTDMLTDAINSSTGTHIMYSYDSEKRLKTRVSNKDNIIHTFYYDGRDLVAEMANGKVISSYTRGPGGQLLEERRTYSDTTGDCLVNYYYYPDRIGNVMMVCDDNGMPVEKEMYDAFGKGMTKGISKCGMSSNMFDNDAGLYYFAARWYDGKTGRFVEMDPIVNDKTIINMYDYCGNNALNVTDVYGKNWFNDLTGWSDDELENGAEEVVKDTFAEGAKDVSNTLSTIQNAYDPSQNNRTELNQHPSNMSQLVLDTSIPNPDVYYCAENNTYYRTASKGESVYHNPDVNVKFIGTNSGQEAVFNKTTGNPETDPRYRATYNYGINPISVEHIVLDVIPYYIYGTGEDDNSTWEERLGATFVY